jgi:hypothetical protein
MAVDGDDKVKCLLSHFFLNKDFIDFASSVYIILYMFISEFEHTSLYRYRICNIFAFFL